MRLHYLMHVPFEHIGMIQEWTENRNITVTGTKFFKKKWQLPKVEDFDNSWWANECA